MAIGTDEYYLCKIQEIILQQRTRATSTPTRILDHLFLGNGRDAANYHYLSQLGITHVLNCAGRRRRGKQRPVSSPYPPGSGIVAYDQLEADDSEDYDVMQHYTRARAFIDRARRSGGKCLVHCVMGINRSVTLCTAYLMEKQRFRLLEAVRTMRQIRGIILTNRGFQKQLINFARKRGYF